jgi:c-di-GMP-related signal transduction protein
MELVNIDTINKMIIGMFSMLGFLVGSVIVTIIYELRINNERKQQIGRLS